MNPELYISQRKVTGYKINNGKGLIVGTNPLMNELFGLIDTLINTSSSVPIIGETKKYIISLGHQRKDNKRDSRFN